MPHSKSARSKIAVYHSAFEVCRETIQPSEELRTALFDGDELTLYYQPKINASDESVHSVEALLRWHHPSRGLLLPEEFLPAAESAGLTRMVANRVLNVALEQIQSWRKQGVATAVAVNLSTTNLLDLDLVGTIELLDREPAACPPTLSSSRSPKAPLSTRCGPVIPSPRYSASASASHSTTTAPEVGRWHACRTSRSTS